MKQALARHTISFKHAIEGIVWALTTQPNFRIHIVLSVLALAMCWYFQVSAGEISLIVFTIVLGLAAEMINTALESITDLVTKEWRQEAKIAKDVSAGMMLVVAIGAVIVALCIFAPYIMNMVGFY